MPSRAAEQGSRPFQTEEEKEAARYRALDIWLHKALVAIEAGTREKVDFGDIVSGYEYVSWPLQRALLRFSPFRLSVLHCLRVVASQSCGLGPQEIQQIAGYRETIHTLIDLAIEHPPWQSDSLDLQLFHSADYTIVARHPNELLFFQKASRHAAVSQALKSALYRFCSNEVSNVNCGFVGFEIEQAKKLDAALRTLRSLSERVTRSLSGNVSHILFAKFAAGNDVEHGLISAHHPLVPCTFFLSKKAFKHPGELVELLYHEALHNELENQSLIEPCYLPDINPTSTPTFLRAWGDVPTDNIWSFDRAFHAHYVYYHLTGLMAHLRQVHGVPQAVREWSKDRYTECLERAQILAKWLCANGANVLSRTGMDLIHRALDVLTSRGKRRTAAVRDLHFIFDLARNSGREFGRGGRCR